MAFEGNLRDFSLADVFALISSGKKTGTLHLEHDSLKADVCFRDGSIFFASSTQEHEPLGSRLVHARVINDLQLQHALDVQETESGNESGRRIGQILIDEGYLEQSMLERFVKEQIVDTLFELFRWGEGSMKFDASENAAEEDIGLSAAVEAIIEEASRRLEQWDKMGARIPSIDARFVMAQGPGEKPQEIYLRPREWMILCHLHGGRGIRALAEATGFTYFETARLLYSMLSAGLVETFEDVETPSAVDEGGEPAMALGDALSSEFEAKAG